MRILSCIALASTLIFIGCTRQKTCKTSEIPERREFPVSTTAKPCDDFYKYACSEALKCFELREDRSRHLFALNDSSERLLIKKKSYLAGLQTRNELSPRGKELRNFYMACMNGDARKIEEQKFLRDSVTEVSAFKTKKSLFSFLADRIVSPYFSFVSFGRLSNLDDSKWYDVYFDTDPMMSLPEPSYYKKEPLVSDFEKLMESFFKLAGFKDAKERAKSVINFEKKVAENYPKPEEIRQLATKRLVVSRAKLVSSYPSLELGVSLNKLPKRTVVRHLFAGSFGEVEKLLSETPLETLKNVYMFRKVYRQLDDAYPDFYKQRFDFNHKYFGGPAKRPEREERCAWDVMRRFGKQLDAELIAELFPDFPVKKFEALVERVRSAMIARIEKNTWLSKKGRAGALEKMKATKMQLVKPKTDEEWDLLPVAKYNEKTPIANALLRNKIRTDRTISEFSKPRNRKRWSMGPLTVNAYYNPADNKFVMLQGILQYPFFDANAPDHVNLGGSGMVVGHELGHAIDDQGAKYDAKGKLRQWMTKKDLETFKKLGEILVAQYDQTGHNGKLTLGENIADVTGLSFAYEAAFPKNEGSQDAKKEFYLQFARSWCGTMRPKTRQLMLKTDPHAQTDVRVNEPLKHQPGFYEAYGCKAGDAMYLAPEKRMKLW